MTPREAGSRPLLLLAACVVATVLALTLAGVGGQPGVLHPWNGRHARVAYTDATPAAETARAALAAPALPAAAPDAAALVDAFFADGGEVIGFIFYGRRRYTAVQWPYLERARRHVGTPVASGSGVLSRVVYLTNTENADDLRWLSELEADHPGFVEVQAPPRVVKQGANNADYCSLYSSVGANQSKTLVIKIDDDLVYLAPDALRNLVAAKLRSNYLFVSAHVVNHPLLAHVDQRLGMFREEDVKAMADAARPLSASGVDKLPPAWTFGYGTFFFEGWQSGAHAMLQHLMLLYRLRTLGEAGASAAYTTFRTWDFDAQGYGTGRWSINCFCYDPADLAEMDIGRCRATDDEDYLTNVYPAHMQRHCAATGDALVAHFAYYPQREWLEAESNILERYEALSQTAAEQLP